MARRPFSKPIREHEERNGPPGDDQGLSTANPRSSHVTWAQGLSIAKPRSSHVIWAQGWNPPTSPCPTFSAGAEPKSQRHCRKWHQKVKGVWRIYVSIAYNRLSAQSSSLANWCLMAYPLPAASCPCALDTYSTVSINIHYLPLLLTSGLEILSPPQRPMDVHWWSTHDVLQMSSP